ncbi:unnamed protein product [Tuber aestivum]|uniref:Uncharacterized protein n=1 Tax=Tuber aestivum TaxID=59557 RepID=A0A292Q473_9PEZI|nr:unnamed protein product [Tuber aestivum]
MIAYFTALCRSLSLPHSLADHPPYKQPPAIPSRNRRNLQFHNMHLFTFNCLCPSFLPFFFPCCRKTSPRPNHKALFISTPTMFIHVYDMASAINTTSRRNMPPIPHLVHYCTCFPPLPAATSASSKQPSSQYYDTVIANITQHETWKKLSK